MILLFISDFYFDFFGGDDTQTDSVHSKRIRKEHLEFV